MSRPHVYSATLAIFKHITSTFFSCVQELELVEDVWKGEVQDLHSQISQLQAENKRLLVSLPFKESLGTEEDQEKPEGELSAAEPLNHSLIEKSLEGVKMIYGSITKMFCH